MNKLNPLFIIGLLGIFMTAILNIVLYHFFSAQPVLGSLLYLYFMSCLLGSIASSGSHEKQEAYVRHE